MMAAAASASAAVRSAAAGARTGAKVGGVGVECAVESRGPSTARVQHHPVATGLVPAPVVPHRSGNIFENCYKDGTTKKTVANTKPLNYTGRRVPPEFVSVS